MCRQENTLFRLYCLILWLSFVQFVFAQDISNIHFEKIQGEGLTNYYIKCIRQDSNDFLWFGTSEGLFKYDGYSFKAFKNFPGDTHSLSNNNIEFLFPENGLLWVGTWGGLSCIDINKETIKNFPAEETFRVYSIVPQNNSVFWIGTSIGLFQFNKKNQAWKRVPEINKNIFIRSLCYDGKDNLYITAHDGFYCYNIAGKTCKHYLLPPSPVEKYSMQVIHRSLLDKNGDLWMTTWAWGLIRFNPKTEEIKEWVRKNIHDHEPYKTAFDFLQNEGNIWIANQNGGLTIFNPGTDSSINYPLEWDNEKKLSDAVYSLFRDESGIIWIGTENGIYKYDPHVIHLSKIDFLWKMDTGLVRTQLMPLSMLKDNDGLWWIGTYEGLFLLDKETGVLHNYNKAAGFPNSTAVTNILQDAKGRFWISVGNLLFSVTKKRKGNSFSLQSKLFKSPDIKGNIYKIYIDGENRIWLGTHANGVFRFDPAAEKFIVFPFNDPKPQDHINQVRCFSEISKDSLLVGGENSGLLLLHINNGKYEKITWNIDIEKAVNINEIIRKDNSFWMATDFNGLWKTDDHFQKLTAYTIHDGLPSMNIYSIMIDKREHLWLLTDGGVVDFQPLNNHVTVYNNKDGIRNPYYLSGLLEDEHGNIAIGDMGCIHLLDPFATKRNNDPPRVFITSFKIFDKEHLANSDQPTRFKYNQNYFSFEYTAVNYTQPSLNRYMYKLDGLDEQWINAGSRRYVSYAGLKEGTYVFKVKASNNDGVWDDTPATITFIITPPFWRTWWFYTLIAVMVSGIAWIFYSVKMNQWKIRYQLRSKIARDLHDDIGSTLSGINIFSRIALQKMKKGEQASAELLEKISDRSAKTMDALSDIVWSINSKNDDMENVLAKMQEYLSETLEPQNIKYSFEIDEAIHHTKLDMELRKELYLIFKEAIHNAYKYARCSFVLISLARKKDLCTLIIRDNGKGFDINKLNGGNGIHNMQQRALKMNAGITIDSEVNKGTGITLDFHIT